MMYEEEIKEGILFTLNCGVGRITLLIGKLLEEGYIPNKNKSFLLSLLTILIHAYNHIDSLSEEQQQKLDNIYNIVAQHVTMR